MMNNLPRLISLILVAFTLINLATAEAQEPDAVWQARPYLTVNIDLGAHSRLQVFGRYEGGLDYAYERWRTGTAFSYRMKRILKPHRPEVDEEDEHNLVIGGGYEYLKRTENHVTSSEHRVTIEATPRYLLDAGFLATDRNRLELRWIDGAYNARYRNRLAIGRPLETGEFRWTPYAMGELFYDRNRHSWNRVHYGFGVQLPGKGRFLVDIFYQREKCSGCSRTAVNILGVTLNLYLRKNR